MEVPDTRGAGGRAQRGRGGSTPGKFMGFVASPLQLISKTVKGLVGNSPSGVTNPSGASLSGAAAVGPSPPPQNQATRRAVQQNPKVEDGLSGFSFPTLAVSSDSPPTNALSRPAPAAPVAQPRLGPHEVPGQAMNGPLSSSGPAVSPRDLLSGWSPAKLASLNFFMNGAKSGADVVRPTAHAPNPNTMEPATASELSRPFYSLTSLLRAGPGGLVSRAGATQGAGGAASNSAHPGSASGAPGSMAAPRTARFNPYGRPNVSKPPRPATAMPPPSVSQRPTAVVPASGAHTGANRARLPAESNPSLAVATARLPPLSPRAAPAPSGNAPRPPTAPGAVRLAPGQVAFSSGRTGTPLPKFGPMAAAGQGQQQLAAHTPGGFRPLVGAAGGKRQRDSTAVSPLMASGIRNLSEFKRRRQGSSQQPRTVLAGFPSRTPRENTPVQSGSERTPGGLGSGGSGTATTPGLPSGSGVGGEVPATETARKILETLDNFKRSGDNTPSIASAKPGAPSGQRTGPPSGSPFLGPYMPPLDRLDQNHYGGTPTPCITTGAAGFVSGATPSPSGATPMAAGAALTPGPRMALEFQSPVVISARQSDVTTGAPAASTDLATSTLPLSPIAVPPVAPSIDRGLSAGAALASAAAVEAEARNRIDTAAAAGPLTAAAGSATALESTSTMSVPTFVFSCPGAPSDPQLRRAKEICEANATAVASSSGSQVFTFGAASVGLDTGAFVVRASPVDTAGAHSRSRVMASEVAKAATVPLPDDDDDEAEVAGATVSTPVAAPSPAFDARQHGQAPKSFPSGGAKRVAFSEQPEATPANRLKDGQAKDATAAVAATPPATPGGFFNSQAGSTPFRSFGADTTPATVAGDKTSAAGEEVAFHPAVSSFGASFAAPSAAPVDASKPAALSFGQGTSPASFSFGAPPMQPVAPAGGTGKDETAALAGDKAPADAEKSALPPSFNFNPNSAAANTAPTVPASSFMFGQATFGAPAASASAPNVMFGTAGSAPTFGASATTTELVTAPAAATGSQAAPVVFGAASYSFGSSAAPVASSAPAATFPGSAPGMGFGAAPAGAPAAAPVTGFAFTAPSSSMPAASSAAPSASSTVAATGFTFGGAPSGVETGMPPASFGSPLPLQNSSSAMMFGGAPAGAGGFGTGGFGAASGPATSFAFGAPANSGSSGGAGPVISSGFGAQAASSNPGPTFAFGAGASAPAFGASAPAPSFGAAPTQQPSFATAAPSFGAAAPANPFGAMAPSFGAPSSQPAFGTALAGTAPAFGTSAAPAAAPSFGGFGGTSGGASAGGMFTFGGSASAAPFGSTQPPATAAPSFGQAAPNFSQPPQAPAPAFGAAPAAFGAPGGFGAPPSFGGVQQAPAGDAGGGFSLGLAAEPKDGGRKRVKARRHGH